MFKLDLSLNNTLELNKRFGHGVLYMLFSRLKKKLYYFISSHKVFIYTVYPVFMYVVYYVLSLYITIDRYKYRHSI